MARKRKGDPIVEDDAGLAGDDGGGESLRVWDAADIWLSHGVDEGYLVHSEDEVRRAADRG